MKDWFESLALAEQTRRKTFSREFRLSYNSFRDHALSSARNISLHRKGYALVEVAIIGHFGPYIGSTVKPVPMAESRDLGDDAPPGARTQSPLPVRPTLSDFKIDGKPLFEKFEAYLKLAGQRVEEARGISERVHGTNNTLIVFLRILRALRPGLCGIR
jgi:hypothetical protein